LFYSENRRPAVLSITLTGEPRLVPAARRADGATRGGLIPCESVGYDVRTERAGPRSLAAMRTRTAPGRLGADIIRLLDVIWPVLRAQNAPTGHNVVIYHNAEDGVLTVDVGVEVLAGFRPDGDVRPAATPSGEVAATAHYGEYSQLAGAYQALEQWCAATGRRPAGVNWEVYGDWDDDPAKLRTDVYFLLEP
jgi:effector-binding domain-containing protein